MISKELLSEVISFQRDWITHFDKGVERESLNDIRLSGSFATVVSGIRRCGKSTLLSQILRKQKGFYYLNLEDPRLEGFELSDFNKADEIFKEKYGNNKTYFFDEIQNVEGWEKYVRFLVDSKKKAVLTGSNASLLSKELGTKLTGRHLRIELFPFSFREYLSFKKSKGSMGASTGYLEKGGFPEFLRTENPEIHHELLNDVISRDIAVRYGIKNVSTLKKIAVYLLTNVGKEFSYNSIKNMLNIKSVQSVIDYVSYFEDSYLIFTIPMFSSSYKKQIVNPKKAYSIDNGFSISNSASFSKDKGRMLENNVFLKLRAKHRDIFYYSDNGECDFLIKDQEKITAAIQACYELNGENRDRETLGLLKPLKKFNIKEGVIVTKMQDDFFNIDGKKIYVKPFWKWALE